MNVAFRAQLQKCKNQRNESERNGSDKQASHKWCAGVAACRNNHATGTGGDFVEAQHDCGTNIQTLELDGTWQNAVLYHSAQSQNQVVLWFPHTGLYEGLDRPYSKTEAGVLLDADKEAIEWRTRCFDC